MTENEVTTIACDESASEGENLMGSTHPVFVHASVNLTVDEALEFRDNLRAATKTQASELKSKTALAPANRSALLIAMATLDGVGNIHLVDKSYFLTAKLIDLLVAARGDEYGLDVALSGLGRQLADYLHHSGPSAIGASRWNAVLSTYNGLIRSYLRAGALPPTVQPFFDALDDARRNCADAQVERILEAIWDARHLTFAYEGASPVELRELDPMAPSLVAVSMTWHMRLGELPFEFLADNYSGLTEVVRDSIVASARGPLSVGSVELPRADLRGIRLIDSKLDARVQVADILAGVGREVAQLAMGGTFDNELQDVVHRMLDYNVMASSGSPLDRLIDRKPLRYLQEWSY